MPTKKNYLTLGRQSLIEPVTITADGWLKAPSGAEPGKEVSSAASSSVLSRLNEFRIGLDWKFYKQYQPERTHIEQSTLVMNAKGENPADSSPMLFVTGAHRYEVSVRIECDSGVVAGIILYYNDRFYVGIGCDQHTRYKWRRGKLRGRTGVVEQPILWLRLRNEDNVVSSYYSYDGKTWRKEVFGMEISGYNHNTLDDFQSVLPGLFVYGKGKARFTDFKYTEIP